MLKLADAGFHGEGVSTSYIVCKRDSSGLQLESEYFSYFVDHSSD